MNFILIHSQKAITYCCILLHVMMVFAQNPLITHMHTADPTARVFDDKLYVYPSSDIPYIEGKGDHKFIMPYYHVFSTEDLVNWKDHGKIIDQNDVPWGEKDAYGMWAPDCVEKDGIYYYYFPAPPADKSNFRRIGVATSNFPHGPFTLEKNYIQDVKGIDPNVLIDDDGKAYLYFGGGDDLYVAMLHTDMKSIKGTPQKIQGLPDKFKEGAFVFKKDKKYYFTFPHVRTKTEELAYAIGDSPMGRFEYKGTIMDRWEDDCWTNHHSIVNYKQQWYIFYHHHDISNYDRLRSIRADSLFFDPNGLILKKKPTLRGIGVTKIDKPVQIDRYSDAQGVSVHRTKDKSIVGWQLDHIQNNGFVTYNTVDFGNQKLNTVSIKVSSITAGGKIKLYASNKLIASFEIPNTHGWEQWKEIAMPVKTKLTGIHHLKLIFEGVGDDLFHIDWLSFK